MNPMVKIIPYIIPYISVGIAAIYGVICLLFPRLFARWDFHYDERDNPSPKYILKIRIRGGIVLTVIILLFLSIYLIAH